MRETVYLAGAVLLGITGAGAGYLLYLNKLRQWRSIHQFLRLLQYLLDGIRYLGLPCTDLLRMASSNQVFTEIDIDGCISFYEIPVPACIERAFRGELRAGFALIERSNSECACAELQRMIERCKTVENEAQAGAHHAQGLYPKLGCCLGILVAVVLA